MILTDRFGLPLPPSNFGLTHSTWRPNQFEALKFVSDINDSDGGFVVSELPTGSGKTAIATALSKDNQVTALVQNLGLLTQYQDLYGFDIVKGKPSYNCVLKSKVDTWRQIHGMIPTAADCHFSDMNNCPVAESCPYIIARNRALTSTRMACTYKYASLSDAVQKRGGVLVLDEAHTSVEEIIGMSQYTVTDEMRKKYDFPDFPLVDYGTNGMGDILDQPGRDKLMAWVGEAIGKVATVTLFDMMTPNGSKLKRICEMLDHINVLLLSNEDIFYRCCIIENNDWRGYSRKQSSMEMTIRAMQADKLARELFASKQTVLMMSATIGNPQPLAFELGINDYKFQTYPHPVPAEFRPIYDLGLPKMTKKSIDQNPALYKLQSDAIFRFIQKLNPDWRGVVLSTSNYKISLLKRFLGEKMQSRIFQPDKDLGVSERIAAFNKDKRKGLILVDTIQGVGTGVDFSYDKARFMVVAGVPFFNPGDRYDKLRMERPNGWKYALWVAHSATEQACGRVSRGEKEQDGSWMENDAALADGSCIDPVAMRQYSPWFRDAIQEMP